MRRKLVIGNWKMHGTLARNQRLLATLVDALRPLAGADFAICVPYPYLYQAQALLTGTNIGWGAQNVSQFAEGAFTGSISAQMIADFACSYAIVGHSERRAVTQESYASAANRFAQLIKVGVTPVFCVGETQLERAGGLAEEVVGEQMRAVLDRLTAEAAAHVAHHDVVFAYEPVWAIGTGNNATPQQAQQMHDHIRRLVAGRDAGFAAGVRIIYGGSLTPANAPAMFAMADIDGGLVGRCSLDPYSFREICAAAARCACLPSSALAAGGAG